MPRKFKDGDEVVTVGKRALGERRRAVVVGYTPARPKVDQCNYQTRDYNLGGYSIKYTELFEKRQSGFLWLANELEPLDDFKHWAERVKERAANRRSSRKR